MWKKTVGRFIWQVQMIEKIDKWKVQLDDGFQFVMIMNNGLVKDVICGERSCMVKELKGWNIYSVIRGLTVDNKHLVFYREKNNTWQKLQTEKIIAIAESPLKRTS